MNVHREWFLMLGNSIVNVVSGPQTKEAAEAAFAYALEQHPRYYVTEHVTIEQLRQYETDLSEYQGGDW